MFCFYPPDKKDADPSPEHAYKVVSSDISIAQISSDSVAHLSFLRVLDSIIFYELEDQSFDAPLRPWKVLEWFDPRLFWR